MATPPDEIDRRLEELELRAEDLRVQVEQTLESADWLRSEFARLRERQRERRRELLEILPRLADSDTADAPSSEDPVGAE
jgi:hypothetical protein